MDDLAAKKILKRYKEGKYPSLKALREDIAQLDDDKQKKFLFNHIFALSDIGASVSPPHIHIIIHGIRTRAEAQARLVKALKDSGYENSYSIQYEFLNAFKFWVPFFFKKNKIKRVLRDIRDLKQRYKLSEFTVYAHSFGTYVISEILREEHDLTIDNLVLCGAIVPQSYDWAALPNCPGAIINDCGTRDIWPVIAKGTCFGYGASGRFGFGNPRVKDRFHDIGHSDFFENDFIEKYWKPFFDNYEVIEPEWTYKRPNAPQVLNYLASKFFYITVILLLLAILI